MAKKLALYVHVPFCARKCLYCDFLSFPGGEIDIDRYFYALKREIVFSSKKYKDYEIKSVFFGGGTPSFPEAQYICETMELIRKSFVVSDSAEITLELNPGTASLEKLKAYKKCGINRLSIGAQSLDDDQLQKLGRIHDAATFFKTFEDARKAGFDNINVDLMSAIPDQSVDSYLDTLRKVAQLSPEHISAYSLIVEEGTPFYDMDLNLVSEEDEREMYHCTRDLLKDFGYHRYEISNYARDGFECRHNKVYWQYGFYLGIGLGATSMVDYVRWKNTSNLAKYIEYSANDNMLSKICREKEELEDADRMEEFMFMGLRMVRGVSYNDFTGLFDKNLEDVYGDVVKKYCDMGLLKKESLEDGSDIRLFLTEEGMDVSNTVMADFLLV
jgi:oxygen-independent coproporphyrinogen-3 oxidase